MALAATFSGILFLFAIAAYAILHCMGCSSNEPSRPAIVPDSRRFAEALSRARRQQQSTRSLSAYANCQYETYEGEFDIIYVDRGTQRSGLIKIRLKNNGSDGYDIAGSSNDADGEATIKDGVVSYSGRAWWVEETSSGPDRGLNVLTSGRFDFLRDEFRGTWRANNGLTGRYTYFKGSRVRRTLGDARSASYPRAEILEGDAGGDAPPAVPVAVATEETPLVPVAASVRAENVTRLCGEVNLGSSAGSFSQ